MLKAIFFNAFCDYGMTNSNTSVEYIFGDLKVIFK